MTISDLSRRISPSTRRVRASVVRPSSFARRANIDRSDPVPVPLPTQALVRMVNGCVDPSQNGKYAAPVMTLAKKIGIPVLLVNVRMEASHQALPQVRSSHAGSHTTASAR